MIFTTLTNVNIDVNNIANLKQLAAPVGIMILSYASMIILLKLSNIKL